MDGNHKSFWWVIVVLVLLCVSFLAGYEVCENKWKKRLNQIEFTIQELEMKKDSLMKQNALLDEQMNVLIDSLSKKKEKIVYIKTTGNEKIDSIRTLPLDNAVEFLSRELSKEASTAR